LSPGPNLFVVGAAKAGTTSLWWYLDKHPEILMSKVKEPHFFSRGGMHGIATPVKDPERYARLFARGAGRRYRGEASPSYLADPETPERIRAAVPDARIVVSLRDPVERAWSNYLMAVRNGYERRSFEEALEREFADQEPAVFVQPPPYFLRGIYAEPVRRYFDAFDGAALVLFFEEFVADVRGTMARIFEWLGLDPSPAESLVEEPVFPYQVPRNVLARVVLRTPGSHRVGDAILRGRARAWAQLALLRFEKPELDPGTRGMLRERYAPHDDRLRALLGRPLPWDERP
jgi:hypothetical protein